MRKAVAALVASAVFASAARPRGVGPEFAKYYADTNSFSCISDPSIHIPSSRINDDYCDCPDGSDEPGTAACAHISPLSPRTPATENDSAALPGFYCKNKGHIPSYVPFTNVNDGVCDYELCCDGSEEWEGIGGVKCKDRCDEIGKEWRKADEIRQKSASNALKKRAELVREAARLRQQVQDRLSSLTTEREGAEIKVKELEKEFEEIKRKEAGKVVKSAGGKGGKLGQLVEIGRRRMDELRNHLINARSDLFATRTRLQELEEILSKFKEEYNPNFNDEGVKRAARAWEDYIASHGTGSNDNAANERDLDEITKPDNENGLNWDDYNDEEEDDTAPIYEFLEYLPLSLRGWLDEKLRTLRQTLIDGGILADASTPTASESKKVTDARTRLDAAKKDVESQKKSYTEASEDLTRDFGPDDVFRALKGVCIEKESGEYTYELCFLDKTHQKPKKGGAHSNMGKFERLERVVVDEPLGPDGKGLGSGERIAMKHENGQHCWNGPNRSTTVILACSEENEIWKIMEEEKCVYRMEVGTPAVCETATEKKKTEGKDEL